MPEPSLIGPGMPMDSSLLALTIEVAGAGVVVVAALDIYLTVLGTRTGTGLLSSRINAAVWQVFRRTGHLWGRKRDDFLSFAGPSMLVLTAMIWITLLVLGFALIAWPALGTRILPSNGDSIPTSFWDAVYYSGYNLTTLGTGDMVPQTHPTRVTMVVEAAVGFAVLSLITTYFVAIYSAVVRRNTLAMMLEHGTDRTGCAAEWIARFCCQPDHSEAIRELTDAAARVVDVDESLHSYSVLNYFRFQAEYYSTARICFVIMDAASLLKSSLDEQRYGTLLKSAALARAWNAGLHLLREQSTPLLPRGCVRPNTSEERQAARKHWNECLQRLRAAGLTIASNTEQAYERYQNLRDEWEPFVRGFAGHMGYGWDSVEQPRTKADGRSSRS
jgi:hypothetical protein